MWRIKSLDAILATAEKKSLHRSLGPVQLTMLGIGAVIGGGEDLAGLADAGVAAGGAAAAAGGCAGVTMSEEL